MELRYKMADIIPLLSIPQPPYGKSSYNIPCPLCDQPETRHGHLNINLKKNVYRCSKCGSFEGGVFDLYAYYMNIAPKDVYTAITGKIARQTSDGRRRDKIKRPPQPPVIPQVALASIEVRDRTYRSLLDKLSLASDHRENLLSRGLNNTEIDRLQYRSTPAVGLHALAKALASGGCQLSGVPGFYTDESQQWTLNHVRRGIIMRDKTADDRLFVLTLFALAKELQRTGALSPMIAVDLVVGLPPEHYELRRKFAAYFQRDSVQFVFNNTPVCLIIRQVLVYPQAYAAVVPQAALLKETPRTFVIDIGGFTTDVMLLRNSRPDMQFCRSLEMGVIAMSNGLIGKISALYDIKIDDDHIADVIQGRPTILPDDVREAIFSAVRVYAHGILDKLRELQVDLRANPAIFVGGGAALFKPFLEESLLVAKADFILDQKANAVGYELLGAVQLRRSALQKVGDGFAQGQ